MSTSTENTSPENMTKWAGVAPCLVILAIACCALIFWGLIAYPIGKAAEDKRQFLVNYRAPTMEEAWIDIQMNYILNSKEPNEILFHGDSSCRHGVNAKLYEELSGLKAFNIGTTGWIGWSGYYVLLERYLQNHPTPKIVVFCFSPFSLSEKDPLAGRYEERVVWSYGSGSEETRPAHRNKYRYYTEEGLRSTFGSITNKLRISRFKPAEEGGTDWLKRIWESHRGAFILDGQRSDPDDPWELMNIEMTTTSLTLLKKLAALLDKYNILLAVRLMPSCQGTASLSTSTYEQLNRFEHETKNVVICRPEILDYEPGLFFDSLHLNREGSTKVTSLIDKELREIIRLRNINLKVR